MAAIDDFNHIKDVLDALDTLRPARLAYTQSAVDATGAAELTALEGVYAIDDSSQINSIPDPDQVMMDDAVMAVGLRSQAATLSRMMINHFLGRLGLNLLKLTEKVKLLAENHLVNRYIAASGKLMEYVSFTYTSTKITMTQHVSSLSASAPDTTAVDIDINAAVSEGNAGVMTGADKKKLDDLDSDAVRMAGVQSITGVKTFTAIPAFNGGTSGVSAPFSVNSTQVVTDLNADKFDGCDIETTLTNSSDKVPRSDAVYAKLSKINTTAPATPVDGDIWIS